MTTSIPETALKPGDRVIYLGDDDTLLGEAGTLARLDQFSFGLRCLVRLDNGDLLDAAAKLFSHTTPPDTTARARRALEDQSSSPATLRGALRLLLAHTELSEGAR